MGQSTAKENIHEGFSIPMTSPADRHQQVLVVEDDESVTKMLLWLLRSAGFSAQTASTGQEALQTLDREAVDAVLLDLGLPDQRAGDVIQRLRAWKGHPEWLVISVMDPGEAARKYGPLGDRFISKPFDPWVLIRRLDGLLDAHQKPQGALD